jgi:hypothetical protein
MFGYKRLILAVNKNWQTEKTKKIIEKTEPWKKTD